MKSRKLRNDDQGVTSFEYGFILAAVAVAIVIVVTVLGASIADLFSFAMPSHR